MSLEKLNRILWVSLGISVLVGLYVSRKPLCINSKVIERLDIINGEKIESAWSCQANHETPWSVSLFRHLGEWQTRISATEEALTRIQPFVEPIRMVVQMQRPWVFQVQRGTFTVGGQIIGAEGHLERGLVKAWVLQKAPQLSTDALAEEVVTDLVQGMLTSSLRFEDPNHALRTKAWSQWPQVIKESHAYCASPWKRSEHFELCRKNPSLFEADAFRLSLRPLLSSALLSAWSDLPLLDRIEVFRNVGTWLPDLKPTTTAVSEPALASTVTAVHELQNMFASVGLVQSSVRPLDQSFGTHLQQAGFNEADSKVSLDVLVISDFPLEWDSPLLKQLSEFAAQEPALKIAVKDPRRLSLMPSRNRIPLDDLTGLRADRVAVLRCGRFDFDWVLSFESMAQKLFVIDQCGSQMPDLRPWIRHGPEGFASSNKQMRFIQFHLPSLALRKASLDRQLDVLSLIQKRDISDPFFQTLGWQELNWSQSLNAYLPRAQIEAIEWFRIN